MRGSTAQQPHPQAGQTTNDLVLLHGWGADSRIWEPMLPLLRRDYRVHLVDLPGYDAAQTSYPHSIGELVESMLPKLPEKAAYLGWSLGGSIATWIAAHHPTRVSAVVTIASNPCFVAKDGWKQAMPQSDFEAFWQRLERDPKQCLNYFGRLQALGDREQSQLQAELRGLQARHASPAVLQQSLQMLAQLDVREELRKLHQPCLSILGSEDSLVPHTMAQALPPSIQCWTANGCAHIPQRTRTQAVAARVSDFLLQHLAEPEIPRAKRAVARSFSAADKYDDGAQLQREVGNALLEQVPRSSRDAVLDLGSGTGYFTAELAERCRAEQVLGLDIAEGMLKRAAQRGTNSTWICGDAESLPLASESIDLVFSSLAIQWCQQLPTLAEELSRVLKPGGAAHISTLGPNTLWELRAAWRAVDRDVHVNRFKPISELRAAFEPAGLVVDKIETSNWMRKAKTVQQLSRELRAIGAHNVNPGRAAGLGGKSRWRRLAEAYQLLATGEASLPVTWEVCFLSLRKPKGN